MTNDADTDEALAGRLVAFMRPITMDDVRLCVGEGKLTPLDVLAGCNLVLSQRRRLAASRLGGEAPETSEPDAGAPRPG